MNSKKDKLVELKLQGHSCDDCVFHILKSYHLGTCFTCCFHDRWDVNSYYSTKEDLNINMCIHWKKEKNYE